MKFFANAVTSEVSGNVITIAFNSILGGFGDMTNAITNFGLADG